MIVRVRLDEFRIVTGCAYVTPSGTEDMYTAAGAICGRVTSSGCVRPTTSSPAMMSTSPTSRPGPEGRKPTWTDPPSPSARVTGPPSSAAANGSSAVTPSTVTGSGRWFVNGMGIAPLSSS